jgi:transposase
MSFYALCNFCPVLSSHLDSSSISVEGDYLICERENEENLEPIPIKIVRGHSKDKRPDLKQFLVNLIASGDNGVPLFFPDFFRIKSGKNRG